MEKFKKNISLFMYTIKLIYKIDKKCFIYTLFLYSINGIFPIATLLLTQNIINEIQLLQKPFGVLLRLMIIYFMISIVGAIFQNISNYNLNKLNNILQYGINRILMEKCGKLSLEMLERTETYDSITRLEQEIAVKPYQTLQSIMNMFSSSVSMVCASMIVISWNKWIQIILIIISLSMFVGEIFIGNREFIMKYKRSNKEREAWYYSYLLTHDTAFKEIKSFNLTNYFLTKYKAISAIFIEQENKIEKFKMCLNIIIDLVQDIFTLATMILAISAAYTGKIMIGTAMSYLNAITMVQNSTTSVASSIYSIYNANLYMELLRNFLNNTECEECIDKSKPGVEEIKSIELKNIGYDYPEFKKVLSDISIKISKGEQIAIVGKNGSGKSTLLKIISGLYKVKEGMFVVNGEDFDNLDIESYRKKTSVLFQDFLKFEGAVNSNIIIGDIEKSYDPDNIIKALDKANIDFLDNDGIYDLEKTLGNWFDNGSQLSGGQWQKIALARAYYKDADIYLLDEPSSALDAIAERKIFQSFFDISKDKIAIYITHRVKIAKNSTKIIVMEQGKIVGVGNHQELIENCNVYSEMYQKELMDDGVYSKVACTCP
ncbi:ABC transporter ATP-binding protein [Paraclostridium sordellii]|uniref:ABC transporter ATP-binding protein n=1 Tax=Paraclostridium sordellii TaxID=1505 RepID=UPI0005E83AA0|nr:ABC transporter ATP-binding protein [Paeniclostridium sordellii]CEN23948.1 putative lantibiotic ABC transporterATP-binding protein [[Clostridium] sordellii] [Paeniclostridium sordellii]